jgi:hypothetical protein
MFKRIYRSRYCTLFSFILVFVCTSLLVRTVLLFGSFTKASFSYTGILKIYLLGLDYDIGVALLLTTIYNLYLLITPRKLSSSIRDKIITYLVLFLLLLISFFSFFAEFTFWQEFESQFNFIAVDYLIHTYEFVNNFNESYPLPFLIGEILVLIILLMWMFTKGKLAQYTFESNMPFKKRLAISGTLLVSDVVAIAGIGILSTKVIYLVYPYIKRKLSNGKSANIIVSSGYQNGGMNFTLIKRLQ